MQNKDVSSGKEHSTLGCFYSPPVSQIAGQSKFIVKIENNIILASICFNELYGI